MARFYGSVKGSRGEVSRLGSTVGGLTTLAASNSGAVRIRLYDRDGIDCIRIILAAWRGKGAEGLIFDGPVSQLDELLPGSAKPVPGTVDPGLNNYVVRTVRPGPGPVELNIPAINEEAARQEAFSFPGVVAVLEVRRM
jgi:hypothetical protein